MALALALSAYSGGGRLALDFHWELYPQAELIKEGKPAFDAPDAHLEDGTNLIWPIAAVLPVVPLTLVGPDAADWVATSFTIATLFAALLVLGVRDWRIFGVTLLWPPVLDAIQTGNASLPIALLIALMWRYQSRAGIAGTALGLAVAVKFFIWPVAAWLLVVGRIRAAIIAALVSLASVLLMIPFTDLGNYVRLISKLRRVFEHGAYTPFALLSDVGVPDVAARTVTVTLGLAILGLACRRRSLGLALAAALCLSPIVWRHFFALLVVPLAIARPRFDAAWFVPLGMWAATGTGNGAPWQTALVLVLAGLTVALAERPVTRHERGLTAGTIPADA